jgi:hypothetical protein
LLTYELTSAIFKAKHNADVSDMPSWSCSNISASVTSWDPTTNKISTTVDAYNCAKVVSGPGGLVGLIIALVQGTILLVLGPAILFYGPTMPRFTALIQAVIVSAYVMLINALVSVNAFTAFVTLEQAIALLISTLTVTFTSVNNPGAKAKAAGFALGTLVATPLMQFVAERASHAHPVHSDRTPSFASSTAGSSALLISCSPAPPPPHQHGAPQLVLPVGRALLQGAEHRLHQPR